METETQDRKTGQETRSNEWEWTTHDVVLCISPHRRGSLVAPTTKLRHSPRSSSQARCNPTPGGRMRFSLPSLLSSHLHPKPPSPWAFRTGTSTRVLCATPTRTLRFLLMLMSHPQVVHPPHRHRRHRLSRSTHATVRNYVLDVSRSLHC